ncbi:PfkB family carbohydrate kinase [Sunxiuqinia sp. A32]|uniref:PfkB family carbohydrate kinase n=1 Tax=Sunxiuqinia sp. A32 TaxID=3461496 RepID=UPI00404627CD
MTTLFVGLSTLDIQYFTDVFPSSNEKVKTNEPLLLVGGPATNASVAYSFLGGQSTLVSGVGNSPFRKLFTDDFEQNRIEHIDLYTDSEQLPVLASVITSKSNGDRNIFTYNPSDKVTVDVPSLFNKFNPKLVHIDGFYPEVAEQVCIEAKKRNVPIVFDGGSWKPHLNNLLKYVDYAICSANFHPPKCTSPNDVFLYLDREGVSFPVITQGEKSILYLHEGNIREVPVNNIDPEDTLGAGDFFHGAFCHYILQQISMKSALEKAAALATKTCQYIGTREWLIKESKKSFL